jgi:very-short-patch-repair endonuclease
MVYQKGENGNKKGKTYEQICGNEKAKIWKERLIKSMKGRTYSPEILLKYKETQARISKGKTFEERFGKERAIEIRGKISKSTKETLNTPEVSAKISAWQTGRKMPREVVNKRVETIKRNGGFTQSDYQKMKASIAVKEARKYQILPMKDTTIEVILQNYLKQLGVEFFTHQYIKEIEHGYQCDILIPSKKCIIECDGNYWHNYPLGKEIDIIRNNELREKGYTVLRFWENEIRVMELEDLKNKLIQMEII